jgi:transposase
MMQRSMSRWSGAALVDDSGRIVREAKLRTQHRPRHGLLVAVVYAGLVEAGLLGILIETRHVKAAFKAMTMKTDRNMRVAWGS